jgi:hypothetical protein
VSETLKSESWILDGNSESTTKTKDPAAESVNRVYWVVFVLPGSQSGRVRVTGSNLVNNSVGFVLDAIV